MKTKSITTGEIEYVAFSFAQRMMEWNEPIPEFGTRFPNILESCIETPFGRFNKKDLYRGLIAKASILFYLMIKNHPFQNGNKRIAVVSLFYFIQKNNKWIKMNNIDLYNFARGIAESKSASKEKVILQINKTLKKHLVNLNEVI